MPAGMKYDLNPMETAKEFCRFDTVYRLSGGFNLDLSNLESGSQIPPFTPLAIDFKTRKATAVKNVRVVSDVTTTATSIKIAKRSIAYVGMFIGNGSKGAKVTAIDKSNSNYDTLTTEAAIGDAISSGEVLFEASDVGGTSVKNRAFAYNYAYTKVEPGASVTAIGQAFEIKRDNLITPVSEKDIESLGSRFMHI